MDEFVTFGALIFAAAAAAAALLVAALVAARLPLPAAAFFLLGAAAISILLPEARQALSIREVERLAVVTLIVILFDGGMKIGWSRFRAALLPIGLLGIIGTAATAAVITTFAHHLLGFDWILAGILGAALAPTDPAVLFSVLRGRQVGGRAQTALEGESGINDPVSIALVVGLLAYAHDPNPSLLDIGRQLAVELAVGFSIGTAVGAALPFVLRHARGPRDEQALAALHPQRREEGQNDERTRDEREEREDESVLPDRLLHKDADLDAEAERRKDADLGEARDDTDLGGRIHRPIRRVVGRFA